MIDTRYCSRLGAGAALLGALLLTLGTLLHPMQAAPWDAAAAFAEYAADHHWLASHLIQLLGVLLGVLALLALTWFAILYKIQTEAQALALRGVTHDPGSVIEQLVQIQIDLLDLELAGLDL